MPKKRRILGIDPGTREIGVAVLDGAELAFFGVRTVTRRASPSSVLVQARAIAEGLIRRHRPDLLALERPFLGYGNRSSLLVCVAKEILRVARERGLKATEISPQAAKKAVAGNGRATKRQVAQVLSRQFPQLAPYLGSPHRYREVYWANMFDAVGVALTVAAPDA